MFDPWVRKIPWRREWQPLEKGMAEHSRILAWRIPWTEEPAGLQSTGLKESDTTEHRTMSLHFPATNF